MDSENASRFNADERMTGQSETLSVDAAHAEQVENTNETVIDSGGGLTGSQDTPHEEIPSSSQNNAPNINFSGHRNTSAIDIEHEITSFHSLLESVKRQTKILRQRAEFLDQHTDSKPELDELVDEINRAIKQIENNKVIADKLEEIARLMPLYQDISFQFFSLDQTRQEIEVELHSVKAMLSRAVNKLARMEREATLAEERKSRERDDERIERNRTHRRERTSNLIYMAFAIVAVFLIVAALATVAERANALGGVVNDISNLQSEIASIGQPRTTAATATATSSQTAAPPILPQVEKTPSSSVSNDEDRLQSLRESLQEDFRKRIIIEDAQQYGSDMGIRHALLKESDGLRSIWSWLGLFYFSNEVLTFYLGILGCALGAFVAGLRNKKTSSMQDILLGCLSGLFTMLSIKGGHAFVIESQAVVLQKFNPYSITFISVVVGLFTERVYNLLSVLVSKVESNVERAFDVSSNEKRTHGDAKDSSKGDLGSVVATK